jgi:hypothetical protein
MKYKGQVISNHVTSTSQDNENLTKLVQISLVRQGIMDMVIAAGS